MAAHRGNLNYQDCRRTLTDGYEEDQVDLLRKDGILRWPGKLRIGL